MAIELHYRRGTGSSVVRHRLVAMGMKMHFFDNSDNSESICEEFSYGRDVWVGDTRVARIPPRALLSNPQFEGGMLEMVDAFR